MMNRFEYNIPLPGKQKELLLKLAEASRQQDVLSVKFSVRDTDPPFFKFKFAIGNEEIQSEFMENPIPGFEVLGLIKITDDHTMFLTPALFAWAAYENKSNFMKWVTRNPNLARDVLLATSIILSLTLLILQFVK